MSPEQPAPERAWIEKHRVCWEVEPLKEMVKGHGIQQTGALLTLYARFERPAEKGPDLTRITIEVHAGLVRLLRDALASLDDPLRVDIEACDFTNHERPETHHHIEIEAAARVVADLGGIPDTGLLHASLARAESYLKQAGVKAQVWEDRGPDGELM